MSEFMDLAKALAYLQAINAPCAHWPHNAPKQGLAVNVGSGQGISETNLSGSSERPCAAGSIMVDTRKDGATDPCPPLKCGSTPPAQFISDQDTLSQKERMSQFGEGEL